MNIKLKKLTSSSLNSGTIIVPLLQSEKLHPSNALKCLSSSSEKLVEFLDKKFDKQISKRLKSDSFKADAGETLCFSLSHKKEAVNIKLYGLGQEIDNNFLETSRKISQCIPKNEDARILLKGIPKTIQIIAIEEIVTGIKIWAYSFDSLKTTDKNSKKKKPSVEILLNSEPNSKDKSAHKLGIVKSNAQNLTRDLVNSPANYMTPEKMVAQAKKIASSTSRTRIKILSRAQLKSLGAGGILGVSQGSNAGAYLIHLTYTPTTKPKKTICLVGKGITFDSGGLSIKSGKGMMDMKIDMAGAGAVLGAMDAIAKLPKSEQPKHKIHALVPTCENMINGNSLKPGDVIKTIDGTTVEVLNTDAEGRLILADALAYSKRLKADATIDLATLTGACVAALGDTYGGLFTRDEKLEVQLKNAAKKSGENFWALPLADEYREFLKSEVSDIKNIGSAGPGATTAALFLEHFVPKKTSWAHIDLAGPAYITRTRGYYSKGATGFAVRSLVEWLTKS